MGLRTVHVSIFKYASGGGGGGGRFLITDCSFVAYNAPRVFHITTPFSFASSLWDSFIWLLRWLWPDEFFLLFFHRAYTYAHTIILWIITFVNNSEKKERRKPERQKITSEAGYSAILLSKKQSLQKKFPFFTPGSNENFQKSSTTQSILTLNYEPIIIDLLQITETLEAAVDRESIRWSCSSTAKATSGTAEIHTTAAFWRLTATLFSSPSTLDWAY